MRNPSQVTTAIERLRVQNCELKQDFPKRLAGELAISEEAFRQVLADIRALPSVRRPLQIIPYVTLVAMVFTARFDYKGAFWRAFETNLGNDDLDRTAWGEAFRKALKGLGLFSPPAHWMVNVFPVLYHAIIPEASKAEFGIMVRSLIDVVDVRDLNDDALLTSVKSYELRGALRAFLDSADSSPVACDLIRQVAEDYRQLSQLDYPDIDKSTIRGALLASVVDAPIAERRRFTLRNRLIVWRWDLGSGEIGGYVTGDITFDEVPLRLRVGQKAYGIDSHRDDDGRWSLDSRMIRLPLACAGSEGVIEFGSGVKERVTLAKGSDLPLFFRASGNVGTLVVAAAAIEAGVYAIAANDDIEAFDGANKVDALEIIPHPNLPGVKTSAIYAFAEGQTIKIGDLCLRVHGRIRAAATIPAVSQWALIDAKNDRLPLYDAAPRIRFESPQNGSEYQIINRSSKAVMCERNLEGVESVRSPLPLGAVYRANVLIDGRSSGASAVDFALLPLRAVRSGNGDPGIVGEGTILLDPPVRLSESPSGIDADRLFSGEPLPYQYAGAIYRVQYVGPRPTMWRLGADQFRQSVVVSDAASAADQGCIEFRGTPGAPVVLTWEDGGRLLEMIREDGRLRVALSRFTSSLQSDKLNISIGEEEQKRVCLSIVSAPIAHYNSIGLEVRQGCHFTIGGEVALDRSVEKLEATFELNNQPWVARRAVDLEGFARTWTLSCEMPPAEYKLGLLATFDDRKARVLDQDGVWSQLIGKTYSNNDPADVLMYEALCGKPLALEKIAESVKMRRDALLRCAQMVNLGQSIYDERIRTIFSVVSSHMTVAELAGLAGFLDDLSDNAARAAASAGIPVAAAFPLRFRGIAIEEPADVFDLEQADVLKFLFNVARTEGGRLEAAEVIDGMADDSSRDSLIRAYAALLRVTIATDLGSTVERMQSQVENPVVFRAMQEAGDIIARSALSRGRFDQLRHSESLFSKLTTAMWQFALTARLASRVLAPSTKVPSGALVISRWLCDTTLAPLARVTLARAEARCSRLYLNGGHVC
jgi:hypothetical protein